MNKYPDVTLLITHYNRSSSLERLLQRFENLGIVFGNVVISDDGSSAQHIEAIKELNRAYSFKLVTTSKNKGLGNNINKGQDAIETPYTLYVQEDFEPTDLFPKVFEDGHSLMAEDEGLDLVRFFALNALPYTQKYKAGFLKISAPTFGFRYTKAHVYSDNPHLRRSSFFTKFGRYTENEPGDKTEYRMCISFIKRKGKAVIYHNYQGVFNHDNMNSEPSTMERQSWKYRSNFAISSLRNIYRQFKYNYDMIF